MRLYHASVFASNFYPGLTNYERLTERERVVYHQQHVLESYHFLRRETWTRHIRASGRRIFLDSGAFSAFSKGAQIDLGQYCDWVAANRDIVEVASVLDSIGDPDGTWRNQMEMERRGASVLPCYHYGEPTDVLDWYVARYPYVTIGGMVPVPNDQLVHWLDRIWQEHLVNADGTPRCRVHGFGMTSMRLICRYPWWSVDSSAWQALGANGRIFLENGRAIIGMSSRHPSRKDRGQHIDSISLPEREALERLIAGHGFDPVIMREHHSHRWAWNMYTMGLAVENMSHSKVLSLAERRLF